MAFDTDKACEELLARVSQLCAKAKTSGLDVANEAKLGVYVWAFALNLSSRYERHGPTTAAVIVGRLQSEKDARLERQSASVESGFDIVVSADRYDLLKTMRDLMAMQEPTARRAQ